MKSYDAIGRQGTALNLLYEDRCGSVVRAV